MKATVVLLRGHDCWFGARVSQMVRLAGARVVQVGSATRATEEQLTAALDPQVTAAVYLVSHHMAQTGMIPLPTFVAACKRAQVPVIVDAAGTVDPLPYVRAGADIVLMSAHKNFEGLTAGIVLGRRDLVAACLLQERGIGRAMKVGKEGIMGVVAGLERWTGRKQAQIEIEWGARVLQLCECLSGVSGLSVEKETDPPENRIPRARVSVAGKRSGTTARQLAAVLRDGKPSVRVWEAGA